MSTVQSPIIPRPNDSKLRLGIISALPEEQAGIIEQMQDKQLHTVGMREYVCGKLWGVDCVCVLARIGKVGAASTCTLLIAMFDVSHVLFTGVAGGADAKVKVGDIVVASELVQHDMDCSPLFPRFEIPLTGMTRIASDNWLSAHLASACQDFLTEDLNRLLSAEDRADFHLHATCLHTGLIASGDEFISEHSRQREIKQDLPDVLALEMEGAAVAQVCYEMARPFAVMRTISDGSNEASQIDFERFIGSVAAKYACAITERLCKRLFGQLDT